MEAASLSTADRARGLLAWFWNRRWAAVYLGLVLWFVGRVLSFHEPHTGYTSLVTFGDLFAPRRLPRLRDVPIYTFRDSAGYDGQFYSQLAVAGDPFDPGLRTAIDAPGYRIRRVLLPVLAHAAGLGRPTWVLNAYALSNLLCWVLLAWLLARWWFPPTELGNALRWAGTMFGVGTVASVVRSLIDVPMLLLIAGGLRAIELERRRLGAGLFAAAGLVRETGILAAVTFPLPERRSWRSWARAAAAVGACLLPYLVWSEIVTAHYGAVGGARSLDWPLVGYVKKLQDLYLRFRSGRFDTGQHYEWLAVVALTTQAAFVLGRPNPRHGGWRLGAVFALVVMCVSAPVWTEASAACRSALPLTLAFNMIAPRTRSGLLLLLAGNLTVATINPRLDPRLPEQTVFAAGITCDYGEGWYRPEYLGRRSWRWSARPEVAIDFHNPGGKPRLVTLDLEIISETDRTVRFRTADADRSIALRARTRVPARFGPFAALPGDTRLTITTPEPAWIEPAASKRPLTFSVQNLYANVTPSPD